MSECVTPYETLKHYVQNFHCTLEPVSRLGTVLNATSGDLRKCCVSQDILLHISDIVLTATLSKICSLACSGDRQCLGSLHQHDLRCTLTRRRDRVCEFLRNHVTIALTDGTVTTSISKSVRGSSARREVEVRYVRVSDSCDFEYQACT